MLLQIFVWLPSLLCIPSHRMCQLSDIHAGLCISQLLQPPSTQLWFTFFFIEEVSPCLHCFFSPTLFWLSNLFPESDCFFYICTLGLISFYTLVPIRSLHLQTHKPQIAHCGTNEIPKLSSAKLALRNHKTTNNRAFYVVFVIAWN